MGLLRMATRTAVVAGTATAVSGRVARRQAARYDQPQQQAPAEYEAPPPPPPAPAPAQDDLTSKLQQLGELHAQGILSDEEFSAAKAKALGI
jgi:putative oligomerization/nucleic acid binding protein